MDNPETQHTKHNTDPPKWKTKQTKIYVEKKNPLSLDTCIWIGRNGQPDRDEDRIIFVVMTLT